MKDNDSLAARLAVEMKTDLLIVLSDVEGMTPFSLSSQTFCAILFEFCFRNRLPQGCVSFPHYLGSGHLAVFTEQA